MIKHSLTLLLCLVWSLSAVAQNTIDSIRKEYQGVKEWIALMSEDFPSDGIPPEYYELRVAQNLSGSGPHHENIRMYYGELASDEEGDPYPPHFLRFATAEYNFAAREYHEEYLFDDKGQVMFIYALTPDVTDDLQPVYELRMWFDGDRLLRFTAKKAEGLDYIDLDTLRKTTFQEEYSGTTIPDIYLNETSRCQHRALRLLGMFESIDENTYL